jgi:hypothetical protein
MILSEFYEQQIGTKPNKPHFISSNDAIRIMEMWGKYCAQHAWRTGRVVIIKYGIPAPDGNTFDDFWNQFKTISEDGSNSANN